MHALVLVLAVMNVAGLSNPPAAEQAVAQQVNAPAFRQAWHTPTVRFVNVRRPKPGQVPVYLQTQRQTTKVCGGLAVACHSIHGKTLASGTPFIEVGDYDKWSIALSHEVIETLVDPHCDRYIGGLMAEPADPVETAYYSAGESAADGSGYASSGNLPVSDWVYPAWFRKGSRGPWDFLQLLTRARQTLPEAYSPNPKGAIR